MQAATALSLLRRLPKLDFASAFGSERILILAPHPDDESLGCGGLIAEACQRGMPPIVVILTDGTKSHPNSQAYPAERLKALREQEARCAVAALGLPAEYLFCLGYPDGAAPVGGEAMHSAAAKLAKLLEEHACTILAAPWRHDPHCDHAAAARIAEHACRLTGARLLAYPIWGLTLAPDEQIDEAAIRGFQLDVSQHLAAKRAAIAAHRSQYAGIITDDPNGFQMAPDFVERFLTATETYIQQAARA